jgi:DNA-binding transcriptional LysR family regulator
MNSHIDISKIRKLDGGLLIILQQLLQHHSVTKTAGQLNLSQSTISHSLTRLRELFDDPLFIRRPHGLEPTALAYELEPKIESLLSQIAATLSVNEYFDPTNEHRQFNISAPEFVTVVLATPLLKHLKQIAPSITVRFIHLSEDEAYEQLRRGNLDVAIGRFVQSQPAGIALQPYFEDQFCIAANKHHPILKGALTQQRYQSSNHIWAYAESETIEADSGFDYSEFHGSLVEGWLSALTIAANSDYIATCPKSLVVSMQKLMGLGFRDLLTPGGKIKVHMATRQGLTNSGTAWLVEQLQISRAGAVTSLQPTS